MRRIVGGLVLGASLLLPMSFGCDRTVSEHEKTTRDRDGDVKTERTTVKEHPDGTQSVEKETDVHRQ
jgi:hypothetical protein